MKRALRKDVPVSSLTPTEVVILRLISEGLTQKQIADELHVSVRTVENHRSNLSTKVKIRSVALPTRYAIRQGIVSA